MKTQPNANSNATILVDMLAQACAIVFIAGLGYCFLFGFVPVFQQSLTLAGGSNSNHEHPTPGRRSSALP